MPPPNPRPRLTDRRPPLVCIHGFMQSARVWELVRPRLAAKFNPLTPALPGHAGGAPLERPITDQLMADAVEAAMDAAGIDMAPVVGNSLGGYLALQLAERGRASSVVALAPAHASETLLRFQLDLHAATKRAAAHVDRIVATAEGRRRLTALLVESYEHIPPELIADLTLAVAQCDAEPMLEYAARSAWPLDFERIACPVRIVWGDADRLLPWPEAAARYRANLPNADWVVLDGVGHCPQLDVPVECAELIAGF